MFSMDDGVIDHIIDSDEDELSSDVEMIQQPAPDTTMLVSMISELTETVKSLTQTVNRMESRLDILDKSQAGRDSVYVDHLAAIKSACVPEKKFKSGWPLKTMKDLNAMEAKMGNAVFDVKLVITFYCLFVIEI